MTIVRFGALILTCMLAAAVGAMAADPVVGTWALSLAKSSYKPGPAPKSQTRVYEAAGKGMRVTVTTENANGLRTVFQFESRDDDKDYPVTGDSEADAVSMQKVTDLLSEATLKHAGKPIAFVIREISPDGKTMKMTYTGATLAKGFEERVTNISIYEKQ